MEPAAGDAATKTATFRRPARAATRVGAAAPAVGDVSGQAPVSVGFRTHGDAVSAEDFLFSTKTLVSAACKRPEDLSECIVELTAVQGANAAQSKTQVASDFFLSASSGSGAASAAERSAAPSGWICRAYCGTEKHVQHAQGAISVHQRLMDVRFVSDAAKGKAQAKVLSFLEAQQRYGLSHVEVTIIDQFVSRSDMFLIGEALRDRVLYLGQQVTYEGFRLRVSELLRPSSRSDATSSAPTLSTESCSSGIVTATTKINFLSLSYVHTILLEFSSEMWSPTIDGRTSMYWALEKFLVELSEQFPKYRSVPLVRIVLFGRLRQGFALADGVRDIFHTVHLQRNSQDLARLSEIAKAHAEIFLEKVAQALSTTDHPRTVFTAARHSNFLPALNLVLEYYTNHHIDRRLDTTGQAVTLITAGTGLYRVTNDLAQITATKMLDIGIRKCTMVCIGRPPLHATPLFEYSSDDPTLRSQYHLQLDPRARERFYEQPEWVACLFYHPTLNAQPVGASYRFALMTREQWQAEFPYLRSGEHHYRPGIDLPQLQLPDTVARAAPFQPVLRRESSGEISGAAKQLSGAPFVRPAEPTVGSLGSLRHSSLLGSTPSKQSTILTLGGQLSSKHQSRLSAPLYRMSNKKGTMFGFGDHSSSSMPQPFVQARWYKQQRSSAAPAFASGAVEAQYIHVVSSNVLDADLYHGTLKLELTLDPFVMNGLIWNPQLNASSQLWGVFLSCFSAHSDALRGAGYESPRPKVSKWEPQLHFTPSKTFVCGATLFVLLSPAPNALFDAAEEMLFSYDPSLFVGDQAADDGVSQPMAVTKEAPRTYDGEFDMASSAFFRQRRPQAGSTVSIGSIQIRSSILFAIQPVNPYKGADFDKIQQPIADADTRRSLDVYVTAAQVQQMRWHSSHPQNPSASSWATLCRSPILPTYGQKPPYSADSLCDEGRRQYWLTTTGSSRAAKSVAPLIIKEFLLQRLHQQYQLVHVRHVDVSSAAVATPSGDSQAGIVTVTSAQGSSWSRHIEPLEEFELTIGHQTHTIQVADDSRGVFVQRILHKGMYESNTAHLHSYQYAFLNHTTNSFTQREIRLEAVFGERFDFAWHELDRYLSSRSGEIPNFLLKDRQLCYVLLPEKCKGGGTSNDQAQVEQQTFPRFKAFVTSRFSTKLKPKEGQQIDWQLSVDPLTFDANTFPVLNAPMKHGARVEDLNEQKTTHLRAVILEHKKDDPERCPDAVLRRPVDPLTGTTRHDVFIDDRLMGADIDLSSYYHEACAYVMRLSWLCCASTIISDWTKGLVLNASLYGLRVVQVPCVYDPMECGSTLRPQYHANPPPHVHDHSFRENFLLRLAKQYGYFPEVPQMNLHCRLVHATGLCFVLSLPTKSGLLWSENYVNRVGTTEQVELLRQFQTAERETVADFMTTTT